MLPSNFPSNTSKQDCSQEEQTATLTLVPGALSRSQTHKHWTASAKWHLQSYIIGSNADPLRPQTLLLAS